MSVEPPASGRPTRPPSGPLSDRAQPPSGPPPPPPAPTPGGDEPPPEPGRPWWKSVPRVATAAVLVAALATVGVLVTRGDGGGGGREVFLVAADEEGPDPFTRSTAGKSAVRPVTPSPTQSVGTNEVRRLNAGRAGVYGGTEKVSACDVERQISYLRENPAKNKAFGSVLGIAPSDVPGYLRGLTPVQLQWDTRVTNHGYRDGKAQPYQAILQSGTAVLVNDRGMPRVRCACGNPLTNPVQQHSGYRRTGDTWPAFSPANVVVMQPAQQVVTTFVLRDSENGQWVARPRGDDGDNDEPTRPPRAMPTPSVTVVSPSPDDGTSTPDEDTSSPDEDTSTPDEETSTPEEDTSTPDEETSTPDEDTSTPEEDTSTPDEETSTPDEDTSTPEEDTSTPAEQTSPPGLVTSTPEEGTSTSGPENLSPPEPVTSTPLPESPPESSPTARLVAAALPPGVPGPAASAPSV
ncbi:DUF6777 domain-containing protein [Streptomyces glaucescens]|uniref:DUF6777 domain-containing protein n=1 Tax=Streptomyces glaucescens TaxID=1907 RepID=A0A089X0N3_STRGA|nr:DUF6777 domain-containing protein [Streptomyces glaucescens]AIR96583.1 hypothetical protein SGLAU_02775 [Streptomyces glaucescens]